MTSATGQLESAEEPGSAAEGAGPAWVAEGRNRPAGLMPRRYQSHVQASAGQAAFAVAAAAWLTWWRNSVDGDGSGDPPAFGDGWRMNGTSSISRWAVWRTATRAAAFAGVVHPHRHHRQKKGVSARAQAEPRGDRITARARLHGTGDLHQRLGTPFADNMVGVPGAKQRSWGADLFVIVVPPGCAPPGRRTQTWELLRFHRRIQSQLIGFTGAALFGKRYARRPAACELSFSMTRRWARSPCKRATALSLPAARRH